MTAPNTTSYEWAGSTLKRLLGTRRPVAESWPFFSGPRKAARISGTDDASPLTMADLVTRVPQVLGPAGADPEHQGQKYFFVKFLDPSDFPPFAYVGFNPETIASLGGTPGQIRSAFAALLWEDRRALEELAALARPQIRSRAAFERFTRAYKHWAIAQASADWAGAAALDLGPFVSPAHRRAAQAQVRRQCGVRRRIVRLMHRIPFEEDRAILIETPTLHAIAGLSLQVHPKAPGNFHPKDELWIYRTIRRRDGAAGWILVEPQRTFDRTESGADFFTPFAWAQGAGRGVLGFRKPISNTSLDQFAALLDVTPHPKSRYVRLAQPMAMPGGSVKGAARWSRVVDEPSWPYFFVWELRFDGAGEAAMPLAHQSFIELHATQGEIKLTLTGRGGRTTRCRISPDQPVFLPASLPYDVLTYRATRPARLMFFSRRLRMDSR